MWSASLSPGTRGAQRGRRRAREPNPSTVTLVNKPTTAATCLATRFAADGKLRGDGTKARPLRTNSPRTCQHQRAREEPWCQLIDLYGLSESG
jgi:hypothetical protein